VTQTIKISLNGEPFEIGSKSALTDLVKVLELSQERYAIEVNLDIIPRSLHSQHLLEHGDKVEIVQAIGGG